MEMMSFGIPSVITPTLSLSRPEGEGNPGFPDENYLKDRDSTTYPPEIAKIHLGWA